MSMEDPQKNATETLLLMAVIQSQDVESAMSALHDQGFNVTRLPSVGGFLGRRNATLMIKTNPRQEKAALDTINRNCRQRVEYIAVPLESAPLPMPAPTPITVGGATIFTVEVEHYEEF